MIPQSRHLHLACAAILLAACAPREAVPATDTARSSARDSRRVDLTGAGATFPYPLYARWFNEYAQRTHIRINYHSIGSGGGIQRMFDGTVDFGATDAPLTDEELARSPTPIIHVPTVLGAVAVTYNLPARTRPLNLSGEVLADIFLGRITRWNDARLIALNPDAPLPDHPLHVVHRTDGSGTSYIFSDFLSAVSPQWLAGPGRGKDLHWPVGTGGSGNEGVAGHVKQTLGSIGYLEVVYARQNHLPVAHVRNRAGRFMSPMPFEIASAAAGANSTSGAQSDLRRSLVNAPGDQSYPIASFTWMLISPQRVGPGKSRQLADFLRWALVDGGDLASSLGYVALPTVTAERVLALLDSLAATPPRRP